MAAMERIFATFKEDRLSANTAAYDPQDPESYHQFIQAMITDARDYEGSVLAKDRNEAQLYYYGLKPSLNPDGSPYSDTMIVEDPTATYSEILGQDQESANRSSFVSTDVRDAIMLSLPSLIRLFGASESPVSIVPRSADESDAAQQATDYVNYVFWNDNPGFLNLYGCFKDALTVKTGYLKWWSDDHIERKRKTFMNITAEQIQMVLGEDPSAKIVSMGKPIKNAQLAPGAVPPVQPPAPGVPPGPPPGVAPLGVQGGSFPPSGSSPMIGGVPPPPPGGPPPIPGGPSPPGAFSPVASGGMPPGGPPPGPLAGAPPPQMPPQPPMPPPPIYDHVTFEYEVSKPVIKIAGVPPEEMRLDRYARTFRESRIVGHERVIPVDQLIAMGYDRELCMQYIQSQQINEFTMEAQLRNPGRYMSTRIGDGVQYGEWYIKIDKDGDGVPELRYICTMGEVHDIVSDEEANRIKFALFSCDPISHTIVGDSLADYTEDIQRIKTNMIRGVLDSLAESINPKTVINELMTTVDDALNDDLGAVIRTRGDPRAAVMFTQTPFVGQQALPVVQMLNDVLARRTGLSDAAKGLDPKALQSSTMIGVEAVINGAQERIEMLARTLCETGFKDLFTGLYNEICENPNQRRTLRIHGKFIPYDTSTFDASMAIEVNPNLGKGSDLVKMLALNQIKQDQQMVMTTYGLANPVCGIPEMLNTITDMLALANIRNVGRYFKTPTPQQLQQIVSQPRTPDPMAVAAQAQLEKVRSETAKAVGAQALEQQKMQMENQFKYAQLHNKSTYDMQRLQVDARKAGVDGDQIEREMQMDNAQAQHDMNLSQQKMQNDIAVAQQKAAADMAMSREKNQNDMAVAHMKVHSAHQLGSAKIASQHVLGALAAQNAGPDGGDGDGGDGGNGAPS
jgi:hypothetical protein